MASRREAPLMRGGSGGQPLSRGSRIAAAVVVGVALGCLCASFYPEGFFPRASDSAINWPRRVRTRVSTPSHSRYVLVPLVAVLADEDRRSEV